MNRLVQSTQLNNIYNALNSLNVNELEAVMQQVIGIRKQKMPNVLSEIETDLLRKINAPIPVSIQKRYNKFVKQKAAEQLDEAAHTELLELVAYMEGHDNQRLKYIVELSQYRNEDLEATLNSLGLNQVPNVR